NLHEKQATAGPKPRGDGGGHSRKREEHAGGTRPTLHRANLPRPPAGSRKPARSLGAGSPSRRTYPVSAARFVQRSRRPEGQRTSTESTDVDAPRPKWSRPSQADR